MVRKMLIYLVKMLTKGYLVGQKYDFLKPFRQGQAHLDNFYFHCFIGGNQKEKFKKKTKKNG